MHKGIFATNISAKARIEETEQMIQSLLKEAHQGSLAMNEGLVQVAGQGATAAAADMKRSPETYVGYARQQNLVSPEAGQEGCCGALQRTPHASSRTSGR